MKQLFENKSLSKFFLLLHIIAFLVLVVDYGFVFPVKIQKSILFLYIFVLSFGIIRLIIRYVYNRKKIKLNVFLFDFISVVFILYCIYQEYISLSETVISNWLRWAVILKLVREFATPRINYKRSVLNPAQLFVISFCSLIVFGALLLMLPSSTHNGISFIDALFTSTSAVCVTGLVVVDTGTYFTEFGQTIILLLIQAGGLGILTFASYFSFFFKGGATYENQIALSDMSNSDKLGEVFTTVKRILMITFFIEAVGALFIYFSIDKSLIPLFSDRIFFAVFHSISAFCNAGFSTLPNGLMQSGFVTNYTFQFIIVVIFVFGGIGFPIVINVLKYLKHFIKRYFLWFTQKKDNYIPWILTLSSKINLITTSVLIVVGTVILYFKEYSNTLASHNAIGKVVTALFTATTPRTAGFNSIDFSQLHFSSIIIIIFLMWIGASPASTGGGIKTSTFAIATLNFLSLAKGKSKIEIFRREIADISVRRAFATMTLSTIVIGFGIFLIAHYDKHIKLLDIVFECFSAYSTVGLSLGITAKLSVVSKTVLIGVMFIGRVTMLTILIAVFKRFKYTDYKYPTDEILIN